MQDATTSERDEFRLPDPGAPGRARGPELAVQELGQRRSRLFTCVIVPFVVVGVLGGIPGYLAVRELQFRLMDVNWVWLSGVVGFAAPFLLFSMIGRFAARRLVASRTRRWVRDLAQKHAASLQLLEETALMLDCVESGTPFGDSDFPSAEREAPLKVRRLVRRQLRGR